MTEDPDLSIALFEELLFELLYDVCAETHYRLFLDSQRIPPSAATLRDNVHTARCRVCGEVVGTKRFTIHLSKCMRGGRRGGDHRKNSVQNFDMDFRNYVVFKRKSCNIVRIALENGGMPHLDVVFLTMELVPKPKQRRRIASSSDFFRGRLPVIHTDNEVISLPDSSPSVGEASNVVSFSAEESSDPSTSTETAVFLVVAPESEENSLRGEDSASQPI